LDKDAFMRACRDGGHAMETALLTLDRTFFSVLYRECVRTIRDQDVARDLVQDTFIKVWRRCATYHGDSALLPWIRAIQRHAILDWLRKQRREIPMDESSGELNAEVGRSIAELSAEQISTPADEARQVELQACFVRCWQRFERAAPSHAAVMAWIVEDGLTHEEIGKLLDRTPGATREFISQCRKKARVHFAEWYELAFGSGDGANAQ
jgi:RNA polymerase sigma-70 factor (ECF subfamily)